MQKETQTIDKENIYSLKNRDDLNPLMNRIADAHHVLIYEIRDDYSSKTFLIAHYRGKEKLPAKKIKVAGVLKDIEVKVEGVKGHQKFLEINYYQLP